MRTPSVGTLRSDADELIDRVRGRLELVVKRTERGPDGLDYMVLVQDVDDQERTIWSTHVPWGVGYYRHATRANEEQQRIADEVWRLAWPDEQTRDIPARTDMDKLKRGS